MRVERDCNGLRGRVVLRWSGLIAMCVAWASLLIFTPAALGLPVHPRTPANDFSGLDQPCGLAVDSKGDVYIASAGESKVKVFNPAHVELTSISDTNEPCGLAVNGKGELFVSEKATGKVVRYKPNAYPFSGTPTYGAAEPVDSSGNARGISVDPTDDRLYVAEGTRISVYNADGTLATTNEMQEVSVFEATGGTFALSFKGQKTAPIPFDASASEVEAALSGLSTIGVGNVDVQSQSPYLVTFAGALGNADVEALGGDASGLTGGPGRKVSIGEQTKGFSAHVGEGALVAATGTASYTSKSGDHYLFAADPAAAEPDKVVFFSGATFKTLKSRRTITGPRSGEGFGFGPAGAYLAVDPGVASPTAQKCAEQACTAGHLFVYDEAHKAVDEFDATGEFLDQLTDPDLADAQPTALAVDRSGDSNDGTVYVSSGPASGGKVIAFDPLAPPGRGGLPELSHVLPSANASVATDSHGDVYMSAGALIHVFGPGGAEISVGPTGKGISDPNTVIGVGVDSTGKVYVVEEGDGTPDDGKVTYYTPSAYPPVSGTTYVRHEPPIATNAGWPASCPNPFAIAVNPKNDHVFIATSCATRELDSAAPGHESAVLNPSFASAFNLGVVESISVDGASGNVYFGGNFRRVTVVNATGTEILARVSGAGNPSGSLGANPKVAVDQSNGHILEFGNDGAAREYDASGAFVSEFGTFTKLSRHFGIAVDSACALHNPPLTETTSPTCKQFDPADGNVYVAFDDTAPGSFDLTAFEPLSYGGPPEPVTEIASGVGGGNARLNGTVNPLGFELTECKFEYQFDAVIAFVPCDKTPAEIGKGKSPVPVHADVSGLDPEGRYEFRLLTENTFGPEAGGLRAFGPPAVTTRPPLPVLYDEATLRATVDPSGLQTKYHFEYGTVAGEYDRSTPSEELSADEAPTEVTAALVGLAEGTVYHFRVVAENEAKAPVQGPDQTLTTLQRRPAEACPNAEYRTGLSANLPDCRAYELTTPAEANGLAPIANPGLGENFSNWLVTPRGPGAGESLSYFTIGTLPGFDGNGAQDGYRSRRAEGEHPQGGWSSELVSPSYVQAGGQELSQRGVGSDQLYSFWSVRPEEVFTGTLAEGAYLRTPSGFEALGSGSLGTDLKASSRYVSPGGSHVIFASQAHLEPATPLAEANTTAIYDRAAGAPSAEVVSVQPDDSPFVAGENATYLASVEDGSAIVFEVGGELYLRRGGATTEVAEGPSTFAGISEDGKRVFYAASASGSAPAALLFCNVEGGSCAGPEKAQEPTPIAPSSVFVNVSPDGSHAFFASKVVLPGVEANGEGKEAEAEKYNLYAWDGGGSPLHFVAVLDSKDFESFDGNGRLNLGTWTRSVSYSTSERNGRAGSPTRTTPNGEVFVFQSHAQLTDYDNEAHGEIYRYDQAAGPGGVLVCVSCNPSNAPTSSDALLEDLESSDTPVGYPTVIANVTDDGTAVFFQSRERLMPEDANSVSDVYEWRAAGSGNCSYSGGCLALISSGQGETSSYLYGMSADGHDVFFRTPERLVSADVTGSLSIYDARVQGGIPDPPAPAPCQGDACQGGGSSPPALPAAGDETQSAGDEEAPPKSRCAKGKHRVKSRCVKKHHHQHNRRANHNRGAGR